MEFDNHFIQTCLNVAQWAEDQPDDFISEATMYWKGIARVLRHGARDVIELQEYCVDNEATAKSRGETLKRLFGEPDVYWVSDAKIKKIRQFIEQVCGEEEDEDDEEVVQL